VLVRSERDADQARNAGASEVAIGDLLRPESLAAALHGATGVFLVTPFAADVEAARYTAERVAEGLARGKAPFVVFNTGIFTAMCPMGLGSIDGKRATLDALARAGVPHLALGVTFYLENWLMPWAPARLTTDAVVSYPLPADLPVSWLAHGDMADAPANALSRAELAGRSIQLGGVSRTPAQMAARIAAAAGRVLRFEQMPLDTFISGGDATSGSARFGTAIGALYR
jgi:uncharacterized protein YbjT (DUF2867 family)